MGAGAVLTIDNPNLVVVGPPPAITVKAGGTLKLVRFRELMLEALPPGGILIEAGGRIELGPGVLLPSRLLDDRNPPVVTPKSEPEPKPEPEPEPEPTPEPDPDPPHCFPN